MVTAKPATKVAQSGLVGGLIDGHDERGRGGGPGEDQVVVVAPDEAPLRRSVKASRTCSTIRPEGMSKVSNTSRRR